jgi:hypothetical protein
MAPQVMPDGPQLQWQPGAKPDVEWSANAISGIDVTNEPVDSHCTNWVVGADGPYPIMWDTNSSSLTLDSGSPVTVPTNNLSYLEPFDLSCSNGTITIWDGGAALPDNNQTGTVSIVPARTLAPIP